MNRILASVLGIALAASCSGDPIPGTYVVLRVGAEPGVRARTTRLELRTLSGPNATNLGTTPAISRFPLGDDPLVWPADFRLSPDGGDADRAYDITVAARDASGNEVTIVRVASGYVKGRTSLLLVTLTDECVDVTCPAISPCSAGRCKATVVDPATLPAYTGSVDAVTSVSGGTSGSEAGVGGTTAGSSGSSGTAGTIGQPGPVDASVMMGSVDASQPHDVDGAIPNVDAASPDDCLAEDCCAAGATCDFGDCPGGGCSYTCRAGSTCVASCAAGECEMACDVDSDCELKCSGGDCAVNCTKPADCSVTGCPPPTPIFGVCACNGCII